MTSETHLTLASETENGTGTSNGIDKIKKYVIEFGFPDIFGKTMLLLLYI